MQRDAKDQQGARHIIKNSIANVATGFSIALTSVVVPPVLARTLSPLEFGAWALVLQIAGYVKVLDLGIQAALGRFVAYHLARRDRPSARDFASNAFTLLALAATVGIAGILVASLYLRNLFPQIPPRLVESTSLTLEIVGVTAAMGLPASAFRGLLIGIERNELVALIAAPTGLMLSAALIAVAVTRHSIVYLAITFAVITLPSYGAYFVVSRRYTQIHIAPFLFRPTVIRETLSYCGSTMIWTVAMLLISGLDVAIVGRVDFRHVAVYAACVTPITILGGTQNALFGPMLQVGARYFAQGLTDKLTELLERAMRISVLITLAYVIPLFALSHRILLAWLGGWYADEGTAILRLLLAGHALRLVATPYATLLLATGQHRRARIPPIVESGTNVAAAILLGIKFGAVGVACGVIVGAIFGQLMNLFYNFPRTPEIVGDPKRLLRRTLLIPMACFFPTSVFLLTQYIQIGRLVSAAVDGAATILVITLVWRFALSPADRQLVRIVKAS